MAKHPFPAALNDVENSYKWLAKRLSDNCTNDDMRILVAGESAGGGLAAELCQKLFDESFTPQPSAQLLLNPMLDDRTSLHHDNSIPPHLVWNHTSNLFAWKSYLGPNTQPGDGDERIPKYAAAARRKDLSGLPPAWISVGDLDLCCPESKAYANRLQRANVTTEYVEVKGGYHGMFGTAKGDEEKIVSAWSSFREFGKGRLLP